MGNPALVHSVLSIGTLERRRKDKRDFSLRGPTHRRKPACLGRNEGWRGDTARASAPLWFTINYLNIGGFYATVQKRFFLPMALSRRFLPHRTSCRDLT